MNYVEETNAFIDWLETNPLESSAQTLWFHLMVIANKSGCPEWFAVANPLLQAKAGISENSLIKHRNILVQKGRIEYRSQGKKQAGKYKIIPITSKNEEMRVVTEGVKQGVIGGVKGSALKDLKSLDPSATTSTARKSEPQSLTEAYAFVFGGGTMPPVFSSFLVPVMQEYGEKYTIELVLESGETGNKPSLRHIKSIHDGWVKRGIRSREQARNEKQPSTSTTGNSLQSRNEEALRKIREAEERERSRSAEIVSRHPEFV